MRVRPTVRLAPLAPLASLLTLLAARAPAQTSIDFDRDIRPLLADQTVGTPPLREIARSAAAAEAPCRTFARSWLRKELAEV